MQSQEVAIKPTVKVVLKSDTELLDDVVVMAYGTAKKSAKYKPLILQVH